jgi:hypothetical protein
MRIDLKSRLVRASAAIAAGLMAVMGVASTASAQSWGNGWVPYNGYNNSQYPYYNRSQDPGWTWGERYGAPPAGTYYQGYSSSPRHYGNGYYGHGYNNGQNPAGQLGGLFVR